jgi:NCS2 family nucleobase:cation symporter-2
VSSCERGTSYALAPVEPLNVPSDEPIPILLALIMGLQHAFAMVGGLITPPLVVFRFAVCGFPFCPPLEQYAISAALISSGICSLINLSKFPIPFTEKLWGRQLYLGSGVLSVMVREQLYRTRRILSKHSLNTRFTQQGTSFTFLPIFEIAVAQMKVSKNVLRPLCSHTLFFSSLMGLCNLL